MVAWVVIDRQHHRKAGPFASLLSTPLIPLPHPSPLLPSFVFMLLRTLLHFFALAQNSTLLFSSDSTLFAKNTRGVGVLLTSRIPPSPIRSGRFAERG